MLKRAFRAVALVGALMILVPAAAQAQGDERRFEAFGSFSYLLSDIGSSGDVFKGAGFTGEFAFFINDWFGLGAEVGWNTGGFDIPDIPILTIDTDFRQTTLLFGPRFRIADTGRFRAGAQTMVGVGMLRLSADIGLGPIPFTLNGNNFTIPAQQVDVDETGVAFLVGMHFDLDVSDRLIWRVVEPSFMVTNFGDSGQAHFRISSGLGFEF